MSAVTTAPSSPPLRLDLHDCEQFLQVVTAVTVDPIKNLACCIFPFLGAFSTHHLEVRSDDATQNGMMPPIDKQNILTEIKALQKSAGITRSIGVYTSLSHTFMSHGGLLSLTQPILAIPHQHLFRPGHHSFMQETAADNLANNIWAYTDSEVQYLICRELSFIQRNDTVLRLAIKISFIVVLFFVYALGLPSLAVGAILLFAAALYLFSERGLQKEVDLMAVDILGKHLNDTEKAKEAARSTFEKMRLQNIERRNQSSLCRIYTRENGDNYLDLAHPLLSSRIAALA